MKTTYIIHNGKNPLSYWFGNSNGRVRDFIGFSWKSHYSFSSVDECKEQIKEMLKDIRSRSMETDVWLKLEKKIEKLKISEKLEDGTYKEVKI